MARTYYMRAKDSVTGALYTWQLSTLDFSGTGYPGPNVATQQLCSGYVDNGGGADLVFGTPLTNADQTITAAEGANRRQSVALTANRVKTGAAPTADGQVITIWNDDISGFTLTFRNGGYAGGDTTIASGKKVTFTSGGGEWAQTSVEAI